MIAATPDATRRHPQHARLNSVQTMQLQVFISHCLGPVLPHFAALQHALGLATRGLPEAPNTRKAEFSNMKHEAAWCCRPACWRGECYDDA